jgi:indolepyruvate ferredoxin oxidoreductase alpha subunit
MATDTRMFLSGNEAVAQAALDAGVVLGTGYPGTPSTEILEHFSEMGGRAQWAPNEKVALEVGIGAAFAGARTLVTMKHVGVNVAADPLFTAAYTGVRGGLVLTSADDPGMASSQNEQDNRHYGRAAGVPILEPSDSQEAYDMMALALDLSEQFGSLFILRLTTRICHSKTVVARRRPKRSEGQARFERDVPGLVMIPAFARTAHRRLRERLGCITHWAESAKINHVIDGDSSLGIITNGISFQHVSEAAPGATILKLGMTYPLPRQTISSFVSRVARCVVVEEGDPFLADSIRAMGLKVEDKPEMYRFGELNVERVRRILAGDVSPEFIPPRGRPPQLCPGCPHRQTFELLNRLGCIVAGDIGCYTLGVLPPFNAMDTCVCMGASIGVGLGLRHVLPDEEARKVVSVIGDSTFLHSGLTGIAEMIYNRPKTGHTVIILDNVTTAMTGMQEHPGTGRALDHSPAPQMVLENVIQAMGVDAVDVLDPVTNGEALEQAVKQSLASDDLRVIICRRPCILSAAKMKAAEQQMAAPAE